jgi:hypothetical protein
MLQLVIAWRKRMTLLYQQYEIVLTLIILKTLLVNVLL